MNGRDAAVAADTRQQVAELNAAIRERLVTAGRVDDHHAVVTGAGERIGVGDRVATRRNDPTLGVANRDTWTITRVGADGGLTVTGGQGSRTLPAGYVSEHVEMAYASTVYGVQGDTVDAAHLAVGEHTGAQSAYVGMTRGRDTNTAHLVARTVDEAREQWIGVFEHTRADLGPGHAAEAALVEAARYAEHRPLSQALRELRHAWTRQERLLDVLAVLERRHERFVADAARYQQHQRVMPALEQDCARTADHARQAGQVLNEVTGHVERDTGRIADALRARWNTQRPAARQAAHTISDGAGLLHHRHRRVDAAHDHLDQWMKAWQPVLDDLRANGYPAWTAGGRDDPSRSAALCTDTPTPWPWPRTPNSPSPNNNPTKPTPPPKPPPVPTRQPPGTTCDSVASTAPGHFGWHTNTTGPINAQPTRPATPWTRSAARSGHSPQNPSSAPSALGASTWNETSGEPKISSPPKPNKPRAPPRMCPTNPLCVHRPRHPASPSDHSCPAGCSPPGRGAAPAAGTELGPRGVRFRAGIHLFLMRTHQRRPPATRADASRPAVPHIGQRDLLAVHERSLDSHAGRKEPTTQGDGPQTSTRPMQPGPSSAERVKPPGR